MRLRLGLLQDPAAIDRQIAREAAEVEAKRKAASSAGAIPTVKTEEEAKRDAEELKKDLKQIGDKVKEEEKKKEVRRIRPLSEAKAIDSGANFISEAFLFMVAAGLIIGEAFRARRKEGARRDDVEVRLGKLEEELSTAEEEKKALVATVDGLRAEVEKVRSVGIGGAGVAPIKAEGWDSEAPKRKVATKHAVREPKKKDGTHSESKSKQEVKKEAPVSER